MMNQQQLEETIVKLMQVNDALRADNTASRSAMTPLKTDYVALVDSTHVLMADRDALKLRVAELEATNKRLVDMLWGRRSERRTDVSMSPSLNFGDDPVDATDESSSPEVIVAQQAAQVAYDKAKLEQLEARRKARRERGTKSEAFPDHLERRVRVLDLPDDQKEGLKLKGVKITERLRFEKPNIYVERIERHEYVTANAPELGVQSVPPLPSIIEGCKYDFSVIAAVITMKFAFHMPTYREEDYFGQSGWRPSRSTLNDLINLGVNCIEPLFEPDDAFCVESTDCSGRCDRDYRPASHTARA